jgi:hypothetical protein
MIGAISVAFALEETPKTLTKASTAAETAETTLCVFLLEGWLLI